MKQHYAWAAYYVITELLNIPHFDAYLRANL